MKNSAIAREKEAGNGSAVGLGSKGATRPNGAETRLPLFSFKFTLVLLQVEIREFLLASKLIGNVSSNASKTDFRSNG